MQDNYLIFYLHTNNFLRANINIYNEIKTPFLFFPLFKHMILKAGIPESLKPNRFRNKPVYMWTLSDV